MATQPTGVPAPAPAPPAPPAAAALHPFLSPALLHSYEQRLAWDYQRQLQEHFHAQAQAAHLLRHMSHLNPALIIASEDGGSSERSQRSSSSSSSSGSIDCCSPGQAEKPPAPEGDRERVHKKAEEAPAPEGGPPPGDTPLDALFQLSTKNFDEEQGE